MPKTITVNSGPFKDLSFPGHDSPEDFDRDAGQQGACVEEGDTSICYRSTLPEFHDTFTPILEGLSNIKRGVNQEATDKAKSRAKDGAKVKDVPESFITWANRVKAQMSDADWKAIDAAARECAAGIRIDASPGKRMAGPDKSLLAKADSQLQLPPDQLQAKVEKYLGTVEGYDLQMDEATGKPERVSYARLIGKYVDALIAQE